MLCHKIFASCGLAMASYASGALCRRHDDCPPYLCPRMPWSNHLGVRAKGRGCGVAVALPNQNQSQSHHVLARSLPNYPLHRRGHHSWSMFRHRLCLPRGHDLQLGGVIAHVYPTIPVPPALLPKALTGRSESPAGCLGELAWTYTYLASSMGPVRPCPNFQKCGIS